MTPLPPPRILVLDLVRSAAVVGMVIFHFTFDLQMFGHVAPGTTFQPFWYYFARLVAGSFLFLSGVSLWLAHGRAIRWPAFWRRFVLISEAALLVSIASVWVTPGGIIYFGILHALAASSLIGLAALRLPPLAILGLAAVIFALPFAAQSPAWEGIWLVWLGLGAVNPPMADYVPLLPWAAPVLAGLALAKLASRADLWPRLQRTPSSLLQRLGFPGRHSLIIYLLHQPVLIAGFSAFAWLTRG